MVNLIFKSLVFFLLIFFFEGNQIHKTYVVVLFHPLSLLPSFSYSWRWCLLGEHSIGPNRTEAEFVLKPQTTCLQLTSCPDRTLARNRWQKVVPEFVICLFFPVLFFFVHFPFSTVNAEKKWINYLVSN